MSLFDRLDRMTSRQADRIYSVSAVIDAITRSPNGRPAADAARGKIRIRGILDSADEFAAIEAGARDRTGSDFRTMVAGQRFQFSVDTARYPAAKNARQGDRLTLDDARRFDIASASPDGQSRIIYQLAIL
ncbi:hypothetical protein [Neorhizobium sp. DAR64860/K0K1]|uniref:hypothetical protein n=1 Tax=Neorhizobium sp. DAR64860/K0K1 TaxID=3421955 RepID=UPI003D2C9CDC